METYHKDRNKENNFNSLNNNNEYVENYDNNNIINVSATTDVKLLIEYLINLFNSAKVSKSKLINNEINNKYDNNGKSNFF